MDSNSHPIHPSVMDVHNVGSTTQGSDENLHVEVSGMLQNPVTTSETMQQLTGQPEGSGFVPSSTPAILPANVVESAVHQPTMAELLERSYRPVSLQDQPRNRCEVCWSATAPGNNFFLRCKGCDLLTHRGCYGVFETQINPNNWLCSLCSYWVSQGYKLKYKQMEQLQQEETSDMGSAPPYSQFELYPRAPVVSCNLCLRPLGPMRLGPENLWVHVACIHFGRNGPHFHRSKGMMRPLNIQKFLAYHRKAHLSCCLCQQGAGLTSECILEGCKNRVHVGCAIRHGLQPRTDLVAADIVKCTTDKMTGKIHEERCTLEKIIRVVTCPEHGTPQDVKNILEQERIRFQQSEDERGRGLDGRSEARATAATKPAGKTESGESPSGHFAVGSSQASPAHRGSSAGRLSDPTSKKTERIKEEKKKVTPKVKGKTDPFGISPSKVAHVHSRKGGSAPPRLPMSEAAILLSKRARGVARNQLEAGSLGVPVVGGPSPHSNVGGVSVVRTVSVTGAQRGVRVNWQKYNLLFRRLPLGCRCEEILKEAADELSLEAVETEARLLASLLTKPLEDYTSIVECLRAPPPWSGYSMSDIEHVWSRNILSWAGPAADAEVTAGPPGSLRAVSPLGVLIVGTGRTPAQKSSYLCWYQPKPDEKTGKVVHLELLQRLRGDETQQAKFVKAEDLESSRLQATSYASSTECSQDVLGMSLADVEFLDSVSSEWVQMIYSQPSTEVAVPLAAPAGGEDAETPVKKEEVAADSQPAEEPAPDAPPSADATAAHALEMRDFVRLSPYQMMYVQRLYNAGYCSLSWQSRSTKKRPPDDKSVDEGMVLRINPMAASETETEKIQSFARALASPSATHVNPELWREAENLVDEAMTINQEQAVAVVPDTTAYHPPGGEAGAAQQIFGASRRVFAGNLAWDFYPPPVPGMQEAGLADDSLDACLASAQNNKAAYLAAMLSGEETTDAAEAGEQERPEGISVAEASRKLASEVEWRHSVDWVGRQIAYHLALYVQMQKALRELRPQYYQELLEMNERPPQVKDQPAVMSRTHQAFNALQKWSVTWRFFVCGYVDAGNVEPALERTNQKALTPPVPGPDGKFRSGPAAGSAGVASVIHCHVCMSADVNDNLNSIVRCRRCFVMTHRRCYAVPAAAQTEIENGDWLCERCKFDRKVFGTRGNIFQPGSVRCFVCNTLGGALKLDQYGRWIHVACALFLIAEASYQTLEEVEAWDLSYLEEWQYTEPCAICSNPELTNSEVYLEGWCSTAPSATTESAIPRSSGTSEHGTSATSTYWGKNPKISALKKLRLASATKKVTSRALGSLSQKNPESVPALREGTYVHRCCHPGCGVTVHSMCAWLSGWQCQVAVEASRCLSVENRENSNFPALVLRILCPEHESVSRELLSQREIRIQRYCNRDIEKDVTLGEHGDDSATSGGGEGDAVTSGAAAGDDETPFGESPSTKPSPVVKGGSGAASGTKEEGPAAGTTSDAGGESSVDPAAFAGSFRKRKRVRGSLSAAVETSPNGAPPKKQKRSSSLDVAGSARLNEFFKAKELTRTTLQALVEEVAFLGYETSDPSPGETPYCSVCFKEEILPQEEHFPHGERQEDDECPLTLHPPLVPPLTNAADDNPLCRCTDCGLVVHATCYGVGRPLNTGWPPTNGSVALAPKESINSNVSKVAFVCDLCQDRRLLPSVHPCCVLCSLSYGPLKRCERLYDTSSLREILPPDVTSAALTPLCDRLGILPDPSSTVQLDGLISKMALTDQLYAHIGCAVFAPQVYWDDVPAAAAADPRRWGKSAGVEPSIIGPIKGWASTLVRTLSQRLVQTGDGRSVEAAAKPFRAYVSNRAKLRAQILCAAGIQSICSSLGIHICSICGLGKGLLYRCHSGDCDRWLHVRCAELAGCRLDVTAETDGSVEEHVTDFRQVILCPVHTGIEVQRSESMAVFGSMRDHLVKAQDLMAAERLDKKSGRKIAKAAKSLRDMSVLEGETVRALNGVGLPVDDAAAKEPKTSRTRLQPRKPVSGPQPASSSAIPKKLTRVKNSRRYPVTDAQGSVLPKSQVQEAGSEAQLNSSKFISKKQVAPKARTGRRKGQGTETTKPEKKVRRAGAKAKATTDFGDQIQFATSAETSEVEEGEIVDV